MKSFEFLVMSLDRHFSLLEVKSLSSPHDVIHLPSLRSLIL